MFFEYVNHIGRVKGLLLFPDGNGYNYFPSTEEVTFFFSKSLDLKRLEEATGTLEQRTLYGGEVQ